MAAIADDITQLVGGTPLVRLNRLAADCGAEVVVKLESFNPCASVKDRIGLSMIQAAERDGRIRDGTVLVEHSPEWRRALVDVLRAWLDHSASRGYGPERFVALIADLGITPLRAGGIITVRFSLIVAACVLLFVLGLVQSSRTEQPSTAQSRPG